MRTSLLGVFFSCLPQCGHQERKCKYLSGQGFPMETTPAVPFTEAIMVLPGVAQCKACVSVSNPLQEQTIGINQANCKIIMGSVRDQRTLECPVQRLSVTQLHPTLAMHECRPSATRKSIFLRRDMKFGLNIKCPHI